MFTNRKLYYVQHYILICPMLTGMGLIPLCTFYPKHYCLFVLKLYVPSQQFFSHVGTEPTLPGFNQHCRELMCVAQGHNTVTPVGIEPRTSRFGVRRCTTTPPRIMIRYTIPWCTVQQTLIYSGNSDSWYRASYRCTLYEI